MITFVIQIKDGDPKLTKPKCQDAIKDRFGIKIHRRSLERALARKKKRSPHADGCGGQRLLLALRIALIEVLHFWSHAFFENLFQPCQRLFVPLGIHAVQVYLLPSDGWQVFNALEV